MKIAKNPVENFINHSTSGSFILIACTIIALIWANSPWQDAYHALWASDFSLGFTDTTFAITKPLYLWINDGLMTLFFLYVGLEIKREIIDGELTSFKKASMPVFAALGGIVVPIALFFLLNQEDRGTHGWGIPMATDIAFSLGILQLLGKRVPLGLKVFLTTFAVIDDIGAIVVIAIFYSHGFHVEYLSVAIGLLLILWLLNYLQIFSKYLFLIFGLAIWVLFLKSGVHPTIAGVLLAFVLPSVRYVNLKDVFSNLNNNLKRLKESDPKKHVLTEEQQVAVDEINAVTDQVQSPMQQLEHGLSGWVAIVIMPLFALANAGITINLDSLSATHLISQIGISMVAGKVIGISLFSYLAYKLGIARLPAGIQFKDIFAVSILGGVGFTMSLFVAELAFREDDLLTASKLGILIGSFGAGIVGYFALRIQLKRKTKQTD
ncbi:MULTISPECIES: Na+/H+ antiporter NhaA [Croceibacter]|uniref:Na(+)/H(+) antiporter NhaA n=1 Tax=Croceibacter atlanticus (strain ATCC BAA-628 / JCM 21780 / CIP 108009 / IAM 15332 / KCTC 12090 / HTCC2559) TaxID=216432 RepID=A3U7E6_CROAH|nr:MULTISPECIES: Na+/H+ antiporter NhaA [Croceibacter]EAP88163.1 NA(+)/H(+) antiporter 1 [Croceibacter atlanticus HTCC2559]MBG24625.1 Na+/H+ antiporter NhaA [Croceibacter sp.]MBW4971525.1 Na+/H+ antiporter NhaA [Croceibacter atlanticus]